MEDSTPQPEPITRSLVSRFPGWLMYKYNTIIDSATSIFALGNFSSSLPSFFDLVLPLESSVSNTVVNPSDSFMADSARATVLTRPGTVAPISGRQIWAAATWIRNVLTPFYTERLANDNYDYRANHMAIATAFAQLEDALVRFQPITLAFISTNV